MADQPPESFLSIALARLQKLLEEAIVKLLVGAAALYILLRLLTITDHSASTALAFVESSGLVSTILGLALQLLPEALLLAAAGVTGIVLQRVLAMAAASQDDKQPRNDDERFMRFGLYAAGTVLWALVLTTVPSPLGYDAFSWAAEIIALLALLLAIARGGYGASKKLPQLGSLQLSLRIYWSLAWLVASASLLLLAHVALDRQLWLPPELITVPASVDRSGPPAGAAAGVGTGVAASAGAPQLDGGDAQGQPQDSIVGYVLKADDQWTTVLLERPRVVLRLASDEIIDRTICRVAARRLPPPALKHLVGDRDQDRDVTPSC